MPKAKTLAEFLALHPDADIVVDYYFFPGPESGSLTYEKITHYYSPKENRVYLNIEQDEHEHA